MSSITTDIGQQFPLLMPFSRYPWQEVKSPNHNFSCFKQVKLFHSSAALTLKKIAASVIHFNWVKCQKKKKKRKKSLTIVMRILYLSSIAWLSWHPASNCQTSALSASGTPLFTSADNPLGLTTRLLCLRNRQSFIYYSTGTDIKIKMRSFPTFQCCSEN